MRRNFLTKPKSEIYHPMSEKSAETPEPEVKMLHGKPAVKILYDSYMQYQKNKVKLD